MKKNLLLLHGAINSQKQFDPLLPYLADQFDVHTINFSGHGGTEIPDQPFSIPLFASDVIAYLDKKNIDQASIFGYSMGGYVALYLASHYSWRVKKIFTLATKLEWTQQIAEKETELLNAEKISEKVPAFAKFLKQTHYPQDWKKVLQKTSDMLLQLGKNPALGKNDFSQIIIPAIIGIGELDKMVSLEESKQVAEYLENGQVLILSRTHHPFEKTDYQSLSEHLIKFFS